MQGFSYHLSCECKLNGVAIEPCHYSLPISFQAALEFPSSTIIWSLRFEPKEAPEDSYFEDTLCRLGPGYLPIDLGGYKDYHWPLLGGLENSM